MATRTRLLRLRSATTLLIVATTCSAFLGILQNAVRLPAWMQSHAWPLLAACAGAAAAALFWQSRIGEQADAAVGLATVTAIQLRALRERFDRVPIRSTTQVELLALAKDPSMRTWIRNYLIDQVRPGERMRLDATERYWAYIALGAIGGTSARRCLKEGLHDDHVFARQGAEEALGHRRGWLNRLFVTLRKRRRKSGSAL
jgi:hypothetical protein